MVVILSQVTLALSRMQQILPSVLSFTLSVRPSLLIVPVCLLLGPQAPRLGLSLRTHAHQHGVEVLHPCMATLALALLCMAHRHHNTMVPAPHIMGAWHLHMMDQQLLAGMFSGSVLLYFYSRTLDTESLVSYHLVCRLLWKPNYFLWHIICLWGLHQVCKQSTNSLSSIHCRGTFILTCTLIFPYKDMSMWTFSLIFISSSPSFYFCIYFVYFLTW